MSYISEIYDIENRARKSICNKLDEVGEIILLPEDENGDYDVDSLFELPTQIYIGKHFSVYYYRITKLYKQNEAYYAHGFDDEESNENDFNLSTDLDSNVIAELADLINNKDDDQDKI